MKRSYDTATTSRDSTRANYQEDLDAVASLQLFDAISFDLGDLCSSSLLHRSVLDPRAAVELEAEPSNTVR